MTYARPKALYATAGLHGGSGLALSLRGLGHDQPVDGRSRTYAMSISAVRGLPSSASARLVPVEIVEKIETAGAPQVSARAGWAEGGRVWVTYTVGHQLTHPWVPALGGSDTARRTAVRAALRSAARALGPNVYFEVAGYGPVPPAPTATEEQPKTVPTAEQVTITLNPLQSGARVVISTMELQRLLSQKGENPGRIDGVWGGHTSGALNRAAARAGQPPHDAVGSEDKTAVEVSSALLVAIRVLPNQTAPSTPGATAPANVGDIDPTAAGFQVPDWLPWTIGAGAFVALGGFFVWRGQRRRALAANRRRRQRRRSSRRSR